MNLKTLLPLLVLVGAAACASEENQDAASMEMAAPMTRSEISAEVMTERDALQRSLGERHREMAKQAGSWTVTSKYGEAFGGGEQVTQATSEVVLDGRYLKTTMDSDYMGQTMHEVSFKGYDNLTLEHIYLSMNNLYTGPYEMRGREIGDDQIEYFGIMRDSMSPEGRRYRAIEKKIDDDTFEILVFDGTGEAEMLVFSMIWKRN